MRCYLASFLMLITCSIFGQTAGIITFEEKMDLHKNLPPEREDMKDMIPQFNSSLHELIFSGDESIYKAKKVEEITDPASGPPRGMRFGRANRIVYKNLALDTMIDSRDFMQKQFLITGPPTVRKWKIGKKQKEILGYPCLEATFQEDSTTSMVVWFAPSLPVYNGPADYQGLPGMILQININEGLRTVTATTIVLDSVDTAEIIAPSKGKEVTAEEFEIIRTEKMKEMGMQQGGPGGGQPMFIIRQ